jgi:replication factor C subunit 1
VLSDSSDDEVEATSRKPSKPVVERKKEISEPKVEETTSTDYFASNGKTKPSRSTPLRPKSTATPNGTSTKTPTKATNGSAPSSGRRSVRKKPSKSYAETNSDDVAAIMKDDDEGGDDIYAQDFKTNGRLAGDDYAEASSDDSVPNPIAKSTRTPKKPARGKAMTKSDDDDVDMVDIATFDGPRDPKRKQGTTTTATKPKRKRKSKAVEDDEEDDFEEDDDSPKRKAKKSITSPAAKKPRTATKKKEEKEESKEIQAIFDTIPTVRAPTPPPRDEKKKFVYGGGNTSVVPAGAGTKDIPEGAENCLAGLTFVFTGVLDTLGREDGQNLVKRYGGKVTTGPSSKTSYIVLGNEAGPKKLETIAKLKLKTINEDGLFELIKRLPANGGDSLAAEKHAEKKAKEEKKIEEAAAEMERKDMAVAEAAAKAKSSLASSASSGAAKSASQPSNSAKIVDSRLWTDKYAPDTMQAVIGNKGLVEKLQSWLRNWHKNAHYGFKKAGADGSGIYRAAMLHGPPGIGKTTAAHLIAKLEGYDIVESNASDTRSKRMVEDGLRGVLDTTSLLGFFAADGQKVQAGKKKLVLIMDEVDGMSAGDRGGVGALAAVAKKTNIPLILICNERRLPKMKPFDNVALDLAFRRPTVEQIRARIMTICFREGLKIPVPVLNALIEGTHADIRQIINMISTAKLDHQAMDFDDGRKMSKAWEKNVILKPWDIVSKILRSQMFAASSTATLNDKIELYFNDHELSHLMLQESYLKTQPARAANYSGKERSLKLLEIADNAAHSISNGDLVDRMIHGTQQQWSLMPAHAIFSFVDPASQVYGNFNERVSFPSWLGQNSKYSKLLPKLPVIQLC